MTCNTCNQEPNHFHQTAAHVDCAPSCGPIPAGPCSEMEIQEVVDLPIDDLETAPDFFLAERNVLDDTTGKVMATIVRVPGNFVIPEGSNENKFTLDGNNPTLNIQDGQPLPAYVQNEGAQNVVYPADTTHPAQFFIVGTVGDLLLCQATGVMLFRGGTDYVVGATYYQGANAGEVSTTPSANGQKLFYVASPTKLIVKL